MGELKKGDLFQVQKASEEDPVDDARLWLALEDAKPFVSTEAEEGNNSTVEVMAGHTLMNGSWLPKRQLRAIK